MVHAPTHSYDSQSEALILLQSAHIGGFRNSNTWHFVCITTSVTRRYHTNRLASCYGMRCQDFWWIANFNSFNIDIFIFASSQPKRAELKIEILKRFHLCLHRIFLVQRPITIVKPIGIDFEISLELLNFVLSIVSMVWPEMSFIPEVFRRIESKLSHASHPNEAETINRDNVAVSCSFSLLALARLVGPFDIGRHGCLFIKLKRFTRFTWQLNLHGLADILHVDFHLLYLQRANTQSTYDIYA